jgi:hypothetical protein
MLVLAKLVDRVECRTQPIDGGAKACTSKGSVATVSAPTVQLTRRSLSSVP